jgi:hypothetical protein
MAGWEKVTDETDSLLQMWGNADAWISGSNISNQHFGINSALSPNEQRQFA